MSIIYASLFLGIGLLIGLATVLFRKIWTKPSPFRNGCLNLTLSFFILAILGLIVEISFYTFIVHSDSFSFTLANQRWFAQYWKPINSLGYRDVEHTPAEFSNKKVIFVVGDSFVAGQGIKDYRDRFSDKLQARLGTDWLVLNLAQVGWSTTEEYHAIISYPRRPQFIILSYFIDDIREAANRSQVPEKFNFGELVTLPPPYLATLVQHSYFLNFAYWEWYRYRNRQPEAVYWKKLRYFYENSDAWRVHQEELQAIVDYARQQQIVLLPIIFPNLVSIDLSVPITAKVEHFFESAGVKPLNLTPIFQQYTPADLVVSRIDAHPNARVHAQVADILFDKVNPSVSNSQNDGMLGNSPNLP